MPYLRLYSSGSARQKIKSSIDTVLILPVYSKLNTDFHLGLLAAATDTEATADTGAEAATGFGTAGFGMLGFAGIGVTVCG